MSDEEYRQVLTDHDRAAQYRVQQSARRLHGEELQQAKAAALVGAIKDLAERKPREYMPGVRLFHQKVCKYLAAHLPGEARRLFRRKSVSWRTVQKLTAPALEGWSKYDLTREIAERDGLLRHV